MKETISNNFLNEVWQETTRRIRENSGYEDGELRAVKQTFQELKNGNINAAKSVAKGDCLAMQLLNNALSVN